MSDNKNQEQDEMYFINDEAPDTGPMSFIQRIVSVFIAPGKLGENLQQYPKSGGAVFAVLVLSLCMAFMSMALTELTLEAQSNAIAAKYGTDFLNLQGSAAVMQDSGPLVAIGGFIGVFVTYLISALLTALGILILTKLMRGTGKFSHYFATAMHVSILTAVGGLIYSGLMVLTDTYMVFTSLAPILMPNGNFLMPMFNFWQSIELFSIWGSVVTIICIKKINNFSTAKAIIIGVILFAISIGITTALASSSAMLYDMSYNAIQQLQ